MSDSSFATKALSIHTTGIESCLAGIVKHNQILLSSSLSGSYRKQFPPLAEREIAFRTAARSQQDCLSMYRFNCGNASFPVWPDRPRHLHRNMRMRFDSSCSCSFLLLLPLVYFPILYFFQLWPAQMSMADRKKRRLIRIQY